MDNLITSAGRALKTDCAEHLRLIWGFRWRTSNHIVENTIQIYPLYLKLSSQCSRVAQFPSGQSHPGHWAISLGKIFLNRSSPGLIKPMSPFPSAAGFHVCAAGWMAKGRVGYPIVKAGANCGFGKTGIVDYGIRLNRSERWDAYCYNPNGEELSFFVLFYPPLSSFLLSCPLLHLAHHFFLSFCP